MPKSTNKPREIFISHSHKDIDFASKLAEILKRYRLKFWYSEQDIVGSKKWHDEIGKALSRCDWFVLVLSSNSIKSKWVKQELLFALNDVRYEDKIVPVLFKKCDPLGLSWTLGNFQIIKFTTSFKKGFSDLLRVWGIKYQP